MKDCTKYKRLFDEALYGELGNNESLQFENHLNSCDDCSKEFDELQRTLQLCKEQSRIEPRPEYMENFWKELEPKLNSKNPQSGLKNVLGFQFSFGYQLVGGMALLLLGILLGKFLITAPTDVSDHVISGSDSDDKMEVVEARANQYLERSKVLLMGLVNFSGDADDAETINLSHQKNISGKLLTQATELKQELTSPSQKQLKDLVSDIEVVLLQIANLETEFDLAGIDLIKSGVDRKGLFLKINIQEILENNQKIKSQAKDEKEKSNI